MPTRTFEHTIGQVTLLATDQYLLPRFEAEGKAPLVTTDDVVSGGRKRC